jgi:hypothetical protein
MPAQLVFGHDMILNIKFKAEWEIINAQKQSRTDKDACNKNAKCIPHQYTIGDKVLIDVTGIRKKPDVPRHRPYEILETFTNGTVWIQFGIVNDRINIQHIMPFTKH